jgi:hypothetical protein
MLKQEFITGFRRGWRMFWRFAGELLRVVACVTVMLALVLTWLAYMGAL